MRAVPAAQSAQCPRSGVHEFAGRRETGVPGNVLELVRLLVSRIEVKRDARVGVLRLLLSRDHLDTIACFPFGLAQRDRKDLHPLAVDIDLHLSGSPVDARNERPRSLEHVVGTEALGANDVVGPGLAHDDSVEVRRHRDGRVAWPVLERPEHDTAVVHPSPGTADRLRHTRHIRGRSDREVALDGCLVGDRAGEPELGKGADPELRPRAIDAEAVARRIEARADTHPWLWQDNRLVRVGPSRQRWGT